MDTCAQGSAELTKCWVVVDQLYQHCLEHPVRKTNPRPQPALLSQDLQFYKTPTLILCSLTSSKHRLKAQPVQLLHFTSEEVLVLNRPRDWPAGCNLSFLGLQHPDSRVVQLPAHSCSSSHDPTVGCWDLKCEWATLWHREPYQTDCVCLSLGLFFP